MVTAILAIGANNEFGNKGKLPWGSFPQELEAFYSAVEDSFNSMANKGIPILLVGNNTWKNLPLSAVNSLLKYTNLVYVLANKGSHIPKRADEVLTVITNIGSKLPPELEFANVVCIGGGFLLNTLLKHDHINKAYISTISQTKDGEIVAFEADTFLHLPDYIIDSTSILIRRATERTSENKLLSFTQELYYI